MAQMQFKLRMPDPLRAAIEESARRGGTSLNNEIVKRLELSFRQEEQVGGPEVQELTRLWQVAFLRGLALGARARDLADQSPGAALRDVFAYRSAVHAGTDALLAAQPIEFKPDTPPAEIKQFLEMLDLFSRAAARGATVTSKDIDR